MCLLFIAMICCAYVYIKMVSIHSSESSARIKEFEDVMELWGGGQYNAFFCEVVVIQLTKCMPSIWGSGSIPPPPQKHSPPPPPPPRISIIIILRIILVRFEVYNYIIYNYMTWLQGKGKGYIKLTILEVHTSKGRCTGVIGYLASPVFGTPA